MFIRDDGGIDWSEVFTAVMLFFSLLNGGIYARNITKADEIEAYKKKLNAKDEVIKELNIKIKAYQKYIDDERASKK